MTWTTEDDKKHALMRIIGVRQRARKILDQEEADHLDEIIRLIEQNVPAECFKGLGDFKGGSA